jgi:phage terminase large subunit
MLQVTTAIRKLAAMKKRKRIIQGGTWAGKTFGILAIIINDAISNPGELTTIVAETMPALKTGCIRQFKEILMSTGRWMEGSWNANDMFYTFQNKTVVEFKSFDSLGKALASGKRTNLFINEAPFILYEIADALIMRTEKNVWMDYNPSELSWPITEIKTNNDAEFLLLKATDNEALPDSIRNELNIKLQKAEAEKEAGLPITSYFQNWCRVYITGEVGNLIGLVFNNWNIVSLIPDEAKLVGYGMDFGFTNDPSTLIGVYRKDRDLYLKEFIYETQLTNQDIISRLNSIGISKSDKIIADSAEPKSIEDLRRAGFNIVGAKKGPDSIKHSIDRLQQYKLFAEATSLNLIREFRNYRWKVGRDGKSLNEPVDHSNHLLDPLRYLAMDGLLNGSQTFDYDFASI